MKALLFLLVLALAGGAGYEWWLQQQHAADFLKQRADLMAEVDKLTKENHQLQDEQDGHTREIAAMESQMESLRAQMRNSQLVPAPPAPAPTHAAP